MSKKMRFASLKFRGRSKKHSGISCFQPKNGWDKVIEKAEAANERPNEHHGRLPRM